MLIKIFIFTREVIKRTVNNKLYTQANAITLRLILALLPLAIVMIASLSFFDIEITKYIGKFIETLPDDIAVAAEKVLTEVFETHHISILSTSAVISLFSASSGFMSMIDGMNTAFNKKRRFGYIRTRIACIILVVIFILLILVSLILLIFGDVIIELLESFELWDFIPVIYSEIHFLIIGIFTGVAFFVILHKVAIDRYIPIRIIIPGAFFTVAGWLVASKAFNFYINNFYKYSVVYGSIGIFFAFALWLNIIAFVILIGSQISAVLYDKDFMMIFQKS